MNIEDIKKEFKTKFSEDIMLDLADEGILWEWIETKLTQQREEAVRGFRSYMEVKHGLAIGLDKAEQYLSQQGGKENKC
jgi:hypothetical protein